MRTNCMTTILCVAMLAALTGFATSSDIPLDANYLAHKDIDPPGSDWEVHPNSNPPAPPTWESGTVLKVPNVHLPTYTKHVWFEIHYASGHFPSPADFPELSLAGFFDIIFPELPDPPPPLTITVPGTLISGPAEITDHTLGWHWTLFPQPSYETITFSNTSVFNMTNILDIRVGTKCIPEPATFVMAGLGLLALVGVACKRHMRRDHR